MKRLWLQWTARFEAMMWREQLLVGAAAVLLSAYLVFALLVEPAQTRLRILKVEMEKAGAEIATLEREQGASAGRGAPDNQQLREAELRRQLAQSDEVLKTLQKSLVPAQRILVVLREMLAHESALQLIALRTLPAAPLIGEQEKTPPAKDAARSATPDAPGVYKHGVEITLRGSYAALHGYLARLERSPWAMYWWRAQLAADERSALTLTVTLYTLSLDKGWLEL